MLDRIPSLVSELTGCEDPSSVIIVEAQPPFLEDRPVVIAGSSRKVNFANHTGATGLIMRHLRAYVLVAVGLFALQTPSLAQSSSSPPLGFDLPIGGTLNCPSGGLIAGCTISGGH